MSRVPGTNSITVDFFGAISGNVNVRGANSCGTRSCSTNSVTVNACRISTNRESVMQTVAYPNPAKDELFVKVSEPVKVIMYNAIGQIVKSDTIDKEGKINISDVPSSVYFLHIKGNNETHVVKVIKN